MVAFLLFVLFYLSIAGLCGEIIFSLTDFTQKQAMKRGFIVATVFSILFVCFCIYSLYS